jgi:regulator of protease activity HflC (stomatin/prohibitin superfamily)
MIREYERKTLSGIPVLVLAVLVGGGVVASFVAMARSGGELGWLWLALGLLVIAVLLVLGLFMIEPNQARVLMLFGAYRGSARQPGLRFTNPFYNAKEISLRTRNFETGKLKVNDCAGNPVEIGAVVVWRVVDSAEALFNVDDYRDYVHVQSEAALRALATCYAYDPHEEGQISLAGNTAEISAKLQVEVQERLEKAGVEVLETRISHLAYAQEIAAAMLQRQQASAVVAARAKIVEGAVGMVEHALEMLSERGVIELDDERKAAMVSNLLVVLCSDRHTQPVVNTGSLYT